MKQFETHSVIGRETFEELGRHVMSVKTQMAFTGMVGAFVGLAVVALIFKSYINMAILLVAALLFAAEYAIIIRKNIKRNVAQLRETTNMDACNYTTSFSDAGVEVENQATGAQATIAYDNIVRLVETKNLYMLSTKANQLVIVNRTAIDGAGQREDFLRFLRERCGNVRWKK